METISVLFLKVYTAELAVSCLPQILKHQFVDVGIFIMKQLTGIFEMQLFVNDFYSKDWSITWATGRTVSF